jgi:hypothetical protein
MRGTATPPRASAEEIASAMKIDVMQKSLVIAASPKEIVWSNEGWKFRSNKMPIQRLIAARRKKTMAFPAGSGTLRENTTRVQCRRNETRALTLMSSLGINFWIQLIRAYPVNAQTFQM